MGKAEDELEAELERMAAQRVAREGIKSAWKGLVSAVGGLAEGVIGAAERKLADAEAARGKGPPREAAPDPGAASERALENVRRTTGDQGELALARKKARERRARAELDALREAGRPIEDRAPAARSLDPASPAAPAPAPSAAPEPGFQQPEDRPPARRTL